MTIERRFTQTPVPESRLATVDGKRGTNTMQGYAAVFYSPNSPGSEYQLAAGVVERIMPGAFDRALREKQNVVGLFNHDMNMLLGRTASGTLSLTVDAVGLRYEISFDALSPLHQTVGRMLARGDLHGSSFSFIAKRENRIRTQTGYVREILDANLYDCGPVTTPAYAGTTAVVRMDGPSSEVAPLAGFMGKRSPLAAEVNARLALLDDDDANEAARRQELQDQIDARLWQIFRRPNLSVREIHNLITAK